MVAGRNLTIGSPVTVAIRTASALTLVAVIAGGASKTRAAGKTIWDGVYTAAQADRGKAVFASKCEGCHGKELVGIGFNGPALKGDRFFAGWGDDYLTSLFEKMKTQMPKTNPSAATDEEKLAVIAYVLQSNKYPAGSEDLKAETLDGVRIEHFKDAPPVPNNTLVRVIGCLTKDKNWTLTKATDPRPTREAPSTPQQLKDAASTPEGTRMFRLLDADLLDVESHVGHRVDTKGILIKTANEERINTVTLQALPDSCQ